eukprot:2728056-Amphidinium_carterae.2
MVSIFPNGSALLLAKEGEDELIPLLSQEAAPRQHDIERQSKSNRTILTRSTSAPRTPSTSRGNKSQCVARCVTLK